MASVMPFALETISELVETLAYFQTFCAPSICCAVVSTDALDKLIRQCLQAIRVPTSESGALAVLEVDVLVVEELLSVKLPIIIKAKTAKTNKLVN
jgi:hypothetical protein